jgi:hypothetical protein
MWSFPSRGIAREEVFWSLAVSVIVLLMRHLLMRVFSDELWSSILPWAEVGPLKGPRSRWTRIPRYPEHRLTRVNSINVLDEGLRIEEIGRRMNSKVRLVKISVYRK